MPIKDKKKRREYHRKYNREIWYPKNKPKYIEYSRKRKEEMKIEINKIKVENGCMDCDLKNKLFPEIFEFDHRENEIKIMEIANMIKRGYGYKKIIEEIKKCDIVCANCHRIRTMKRIRNK